MLEGVAEACPMTLLLTLGLGYRPWQPLGDNTPVGWIITVAYFGAMALSYAAYRHEEQLAIAGNTRLRPKVWRFLTIALLALGLNKQLDLQILVTKFGRYAFIVIGMYGRRRIFQAFFIAGVALVGLFIAGSVTAYARRAGMRYFVALLGIVYLLTFIVIRAISFHHVDILLGMRFENVKLNVTLELSGILLIAASATFNLLRSVPR
jgi:hypothetical protein